MFIRNESLPAQNFPGVDLRQQEAIRYKDGPLLILMEAGSGKATVLVSHVTYLIQERCDPYRIMTITFASRVADELEDRLVTMPDEHSSQV